MRVRDVDDGQSVEPEHDASGGAIDGVPGARFIGPAVAHQMRCAGDGAGSVGTFGPRSTGRGRDEGQQSTHGAPVCPTWRLLWMPRPAGRDDQAVARGLMARLLSGPFRPASSPARAAWSTLRSIRCLS